MLKKMIEVLLKNIPQQIDQRGQTHASWNNVSAEIRMKRALGKKAYYSYMCTILPERR